MILGDDELGKVFSISCLEHIFRGRCRHGFLERCRYSGTNPDISMLSHSSRGLGIVKAKGFLSFGSTVA
ncbi:uncharacterized protein ARMOST_06140 [Armillaria ostoyae]|uniref:Uncharacterized protein n=1 Tax=Armillaria ostoyae TaxID=47428 RepID=A0A284R264_ARMOS|nr:uncharacterized protein ARMOST_06140 [Armillaria ostoyae]